MKKALKVVLAIVGVLIALIAALAIFLPLFFDPNDYKAEISRIVEQKTGRELRIPGEIELSVFPWLGVDLGRVELGNAPGFAEEPFAAIDGASVRIKVLPLLQQEIELGSVTLEGLTLRLARNAQGDTNWDDMVERLSSQSAPAQEPPPAGGEGGGFEVTSLQVAGVEVQEAQVIWNDAVTDTHYRLSDFNLRTGPVAPGEPFMLSTSFRLESDKPPVTADVDLSTEVVFDLNAQTYSASDLRLTVLASGEPVPAGQQEVVLTAANVQANLDAQTATVTDFKLEAADLTAHAQVSGQRIVDQPQFEGTLRIEEFSPRDLMARLEMPLPATSDESVLTSASLETAFSATPERAELRDLKMVLDNSNLTGSASVANFSQPAVRFDLAVDAINVDRYLPPEGEPVATDTEAAEPAEGGEGSVNETDISLDFLKGLDVAGGLSIGELQAMGLQMREAEVQVTVRDGTLRIEPLAASLYGGQIRSTATVSAQGSQSYAFTADVSSIQAGPLLTDLMDFKLIDGTGGLKLDLRAAGETVGAVRKALAGNAEFAFENGAVNGFNLAHIIRSAKARLTGGTVSDDALQKTDFSALTGSAQISEGVLRNDDLTLKSPLLRVNGQGTINLVANTLDYLVKTSVVGTLEGQGGAELQSLKGLTIPVRLDGDLASPNYSVDLAAALVGAQGEKVEQAKEKAREKIDERKQELEQDLRDKAKDKLQNLFN